MARISFDQGSFLLGEISPFSQGRFNEKEYYSSLNLCLNYMPTDQGALTRRGGLRFCAEARADAVKLIPFHTKDGNSYVCELSAAVLRFHTLGILVDNADERVDVLSISTATPAVVKTQSAHGWSTGDTVVFTTLGTDFGKYLFNRQFRITVVDTDEFSIAHTGSLGTGSVDGSAFTGLAITAEEVSRVTEVTIPYTEAQLPDVRHAEEENSLYLFHTSHEPNVLDGELLTLAQAVFEDGPYLPENDTATTLGFSAVTGSITVTASAITGINGGSGFQTTDVGRLIRVNSGTVSVPDWTWLKITARSSTTVVTATVMGSDLAATTAVTTWRLGLYSDTTGWPKHGVVHEGRMWLVGDVAPGRVDGSVVVDGVNNKNFFNFEPTAQDGTVADNNGVSGTAAGNGRKNFRWLQLTDDGLLAGADFGEFLVRASVLDDPITPFTLQIRRKTKFGTADALPVEAGSNTLFIQSLGQAIMEYRKTNGQYDGTDLARYARHLTAAGVTELAYAKVPTPTLWCLRADQRLIAATYRNDQEGEQKGWHQHNVAWEDDPFDADELALGKHKYANALGPVTSIATAPFSDPEASRNDTLWVAVDRNGTTCIEYITPVFDDTKDPNEAFHVDSGNAYKYEDLDITWELVSGNTYRFYGLDRLNGDTMCALWRGEDVGTGSQVVASGYVDIDVGSTLDTGSAAYETTSLSFVTGGTLTFNSSFILDLPDPGVGMGDRASHPSNSAFLVGEDGNRYVVNKQADNPHFYDIDSDSDGPNKSVSTVNTEVKAFTSGVEPGGAWNGDTFGLATIIIPNTPYCICIGQTGSGNDIDTYAAYYKINSSSALELVGVFCTGDGDATGSLAVQTSPENGNEKIYAVGHWFTAPTGTGSYALRYPVAVAYHGEGRSSVTVIPSINEILADADNVITETGNDLWYARENRLDDLGMENAMDLDGHTGDFTNKGYFLPASASNNKGSTFNILWHPADIAEHVAATSNPTCLYLSDKVATYPDGFITSISLKGVSTSGVVFGSVVDSINSQFTGVAYPFPDIGEKYDGTAGSASENFYHAPAVFPADDTDPFGVWYCFFPRIYMASGDRDKFGIRVFKFDPKTQVYTHLDFAKGQLFDFSGDGVSTNYEPESATLHWDATTGTITVVGNSSLNGETNTVVAEFGTFDPTTETLTVPVDAHVDAAIGLCYTSRAQILRPMLNAGSDSGSALGKKRRTDRFSGLFFRTGQIKFGTKFTDLIPLVLNDPDSLGRRPLYSGVSEIRSLQDSYTLDSMLCWEQSQPQPGGIVAVAGHIGINNP